MKINVYSIEKNTHSDIKSLSQEFIKMSSRFAQIENRVLFNKDISSAQTKGSTEAKNSYSKLYTPYLKGYNVALHEKGEEIESYEFCEIFEKSSEINFFIGGAYGFNEEFLQRNQRVISLSRLTYAHKIAKVVLLEQIYRGLCIKHNHPYHKE